MRSVFVAFMPAAPANRENVGSAPALVAQDSRADQRDAAHERCKTFEAHELSAQGSIRTERTENRRVINARIGFQSLPLPRDFFAKRGGCRSEKRLKISSLRNPY